MNLTFLEERSGAKWNVLGNGLMNSARRAVIHFNIHFLKYEAKIVIKQIKLICLNYFDLRKSF
jgi:hypothetical protein